MTQDGLHDLSLFYGVACRSDAASGRGKKESSGHRCDGGFMLAGLEPKGPPGSGCTLLQRPLELFSALNCLSEYTQLLTKGTSAFTKPKK